MPMDFPDFESLKTHAEMYHFRPPDEGEEEALAQHIEPLDAIEAQEVRNKVGWDRFTPEQNLEMLKRRGLDPASIFGYRNPLDRT